MTRMQQRNIGEELKKELKERGAACKKWRVINGISKRDMARMLGCSVPTVGAIEETGVMPYRILARFSRLQGVGRSPKDWLGNV